MVNALTSRPSVLTMSAVALGILVVAAGVSLDGSGPADIGGGPEITDPTSTPTPTPKVIEDPTAIATATASPTPSDAEIQRDYQDIEGQFHEVYPDPSDPENDATPPLLGTAIRDDELWVVFDETDVFENASRMRDEWTTVAIGYQIVIANHDGRTTERMRAVGWNNTGPITTFTVETEDAEALANGEIEWETFYRNYFRTVQATTDEERRIAREIAEHPPDGQ